MYFEYGVGNLILNESLFELQNARTQRVTHPFIQVVCCDIFIYSLTKTGHVGVIVHKPMETAPLTAEVWTK